MGHFICLVFPNYLYIQSFISIRTHRYLLFTLSNNLIYFIFLFKFFQLWPLDALSFGSNFLLTYPHYYGFTFFLAFPYFLALQDAPGTYYICSAPVLESAIYLRVLVPFIGEGCQKPGFGCQVCRLLQACNRFQALSAGGAGIYVCVNQLMYIDILIDIYIGNHLYL